VHNQPTGDPVAARAQIIAERRLSALAGGEACGAFFDPPQLPNAGKMARA
jgi:hypothetical protein